MLRFKFIPVFSITLAVVILLALSLQYPFSSSFPLGGDAPFYAKRAQTVLSVLSAPKAATEALRAAWYPLSLVIFSTSAAIPIDWPARFMWYVTASHIITGLILGRLLYRISGWRAAAFVMIIWAITTTGISSHIEDGTLAHLISFVFLALFLERIAAKSSWVALGALVATILTHPINGLALLITMTIATPILFATWPKLSAVEKKQLIIICPASILMLIFLVFAGKPVFSNADNIIGVANNPFIDILVSRFAPFVALAPLGLLILVKKNKQSTLKFIIATFFSLSFIMAGNELLGIAVWSDRLAPLFIFVVTILAALGINYITQSVFLRSSIRMLFIVIFISLVLVSAWRSNKIVFGFYEDPANYARLDANELAAMYWMRDNLSDESLILSSKNNRHSEWIPVITGFEWQALADDDYYIIDPAGAPNWLPAYNMLKYVVFFTLREDISSAYNNSSSDKFPLVFSNDAISIYNISPK